MLNNINIKFKLGILFLILCLSIAVLAYKSVSNSTHNKETLKNLHNKSQVVLSLQDSVITPLYKLRELTQSLVMAPNNTLRKQIQIKVNKSITDIDEEINILKNNSIVEKWRNYKELISITKNYLDNEFEEGAYVNVTTSSREQFYLLMNELLSTQSQLLSNSKIAYNKASKDAKDTKFEIFILILLVLILSTIIGWLITSNIINSIHRVQNGLTDFFEYLNHRKNNINEIKINSKDEFYQMASVINKNVMKIQKNLEQNTELIKDATKVLENIKGGNLGTRITKATENEDLNELKIMMNNMLDDLELKIQEEIKKRIEQQKLLIQQSKLASMGEMIGNIAHQWRQPLAQIAAIHMNMKITYDFDKFTKEYLDSKIKEANTLTSYMTQTITDFQNFFKPQDEKQEFSIEKACKNAYEIVQSSLKYHNINLNFNVIQDSFVYGYKNEYSQVILNIFSNAKDILLERNIENPQINITIKSGNNYSIVKIEDNGGGIKNDILDKIFDPYFTTRHKTQGTGVGLYMSKNIIEINMNGFINVENSDKGAVFTVKVPQKQ